jgi:iron complex outermembrane receptor protein
MDFVFNLTQDLNFSGGYTYDEGVIRSYNCSTNLTAAQLATCRAHDGKPLPFAPKNKFNLTGNYTLPLGDAVPFKVRLTSSVSYTSRTNFDIDQTPLAQQAPYALWDASVTFASRDDKYQISIIGKNLTDKYYTSFVTPNGDGVSAGSYARLQVPRDAERYVGIKASMRY